MNIRIFTTAALLAFSSAAFAETKRCEVP